MQHDDQLMCEAFRGYVGLPYVPNVQLGDYAPYVSQEEFEGDLLLAMGLSDGVKEGADGTFYRDQVKPNSPAEREARAAVMRLLRAASWRNCGESIWPCLRQFFAVLADLFNPADGQFELALRRRNGKKGPAPSDTLNASIAGFIAAKVLSDGCRNAAVSDAKEKFGLSERAIWDIWSEKGEHILNVFGLLDVVREEVLDGRTERTAE